MFSARKIIIGGLEIGGDKPIDETTKKYFERTGGNISQSDDGRVTLTGPFSFSAESFNEFRKNSEQEANNGADKKPEAVRFSSAKKDHSAQKKEDKSGDSKSTFRWKKGFLL